MTTLVAKKLIAVDVLRLDETEPPVTAREIWRWLRARLRYALGLQRCRCGWNKHRPRSPWQERRERQAEIERLAERIALAEDVRILRELR